MRSTRLPIRLRISELGIFQLNSNRAVQPHSPDDIRGFFAWSDSLDYMVLRPLSHIAGNWEAHWDHDEKRYSPEPFSFAEVLNVVIELVATCPRPLKYHEHEDNLAERVVNQLKWPIQKKGTRWIGADYPTILEQGAFDDVEQQTLIIAANGRAQAALDHGQKHFDDMEDGHQSLLAALLSIIIYHRYCDGTSMLVEEDDDSP
jgi:hypothetical protein